MSAPPAPAAPTVTATATETSPRSRRAKLRTPLSAHGEPMLWITGGALMVCLVMVVGLLLFIVWMGLATFWPKPLERLSTVDGTVHMGEVNRVESYRPGPEQIESMSPEVADLAIAAMEANDGALVRRMYRTGNYQLTNVHFTWIDDVQVTDHSFPEWAVLLERVEWGRFYGFPLRFLVDGAVTADTPESAWAAFQTHHEPVSERFRQRRHLEEVDLGKTYGLREKARLRMRAVELEHGISPAWAAAARRIHEAERAVAAGRSGAQEELLSTRRRRDRLEDAAGRPSDAAVNAFAIAAQDYHHTIDETEAINAEIIGEIRRLNQENARYEFVLATAQGQEKIVPLNQIVLAYAPNQLDLGGKIGIYLARWWEFLTDEPRAANSEGGVFPAIVGTVLMTLIMALLVVPFGVLAALYLREYAKAGPIVSAVRISINNLAGVPSIVFGVFGLGFFCYGVGGFIDGGPSWSLPEPRWFVLLGTMVAVAIGAFGSMLLGVAKPGQRITTAKHTARWISGTLWLVATIGSLGLIATTPFFDGFFRAGLPNPTFGKGALIWASFTLALLTLPVVIVATEEALAAVPNSMREGSYACGASKWQTIKRIVLPRAMPGIMTGTILAMARGAGEVAPLMLVGAVKLAPELPVSWRPTEHFGVDRSFMHLGFHIFDLGFQSQNSEAAKPLVFTTTLLLIFLIAMLNLAAVFLRSRLRRRFMGAQF